MRKTEKDKRILYDLQARERESERCCGRGIKKEREIDCM